MSWDGLDAVGSGYIAPGLRLGLGSANRDGLRRAYKDAASQGVPLLIAPGEYEVELDPAAPVIELAAVSGTASAVTIMGAGSDVTLLKFTYPSPLLGKPGTVAFMTVASTEARLAGLLLEGPDDLGGDEADGSDAPACWALYVRDATRLNAIDVATTRWNEAIRVDGSVTGATAHLERCHIKSRGTRIRHIAPSDRQEDGGLMLLNCTIEQDGLLWSPRRVGSGFVMKDVGGFLQPATGYSHCGILQDPGANLVVIGGASMGGRSDPYDIAHARGSAGDVSARQIDITNHFFGPNSKAGLYLFPHATAVQVDNCSFAGENGIIMSGPSATYHISDCSFVGGRVAEGLVSGMSFSGHAVSDSASALGNEVEAYFSTCRFGAPATKIEHTTEQLAQIPDDPGTPSVDQPLEETPTIGYSEYETPGYHAIVMRHLGAGSRQWRFENCYFGGLRDWDGALFRALSGVNCFYHCRFDDPRADYGELRHPYALEQYAGRIELHACWKEGRYPLHLAADDESLEVVLERNVLLRASISVDSRSAVLFRGSENYFGDHVFVSASEPALVTGSLQLRRGRSREAPLHWNAAVAYIFAGELVRNGESPGRIYALVPGSGGVSSEGPTGTDARIAVGKQVWQYVRDDADYEISKESLILSWNADWVEVDQVPPPTIRTVFMRSRSETAGRDALRLVGGTVQLFAAQDFILGGGSGGSGALLLSGDVRYSTGQVATLRYSPIHDAWVVL